MQERDDTTQKIPTWEPWQPAAAPRTPTPPPQPPQRPRRSAPGALIALAFVGSTVLGGIVGGSVGSQWIPPRVASPPPAVETESPTTASGSPVPVAETEGATVASIVYGLVKDGVVHIAVSGGSGRGNGSGFVVDDRGHILTNEHVIANARRISVRFASGETREATVVGSDRRNDIALLRVELPQGARAIPLGDSSAVQVGEVAIAIGSPFGLAQTVTQGIVSAVDRSWQPNNNVIREHLIQTDAPINPGNSGGPLLNAAGEVIGINSMIESPVEGSVGIGFAVGINVAKELMPSLQSGAVGDAPVWLGISGVAIDPSIAQELDLSVTSGVLVQSVVANGPAAKAGIRGGAGAANELAAGGDIILEVNGTEVTSVQQLSARLQTYKPGDTVTLTVLRDSERIQVRVTLEVWPDQ